MFIEPIFGPGMVSSQDPFNENSWVHPSDRIAAKKVGNATLAVGAFMVAGAAIAIRKVSASNESTALSRTMLLFIVCFAVMLAWSISFVDYHTPVDERILAPVWAAWVILVGVVIAGVWVWKRLSLETQGYVIDQAIPMAFAGLVIAAGLLMLVRAYNRRRAQRRERAKLLAAFERATVQEKKLEIAFALIDVNGYRAEGLESVTPALRDLFATTLQRALGDKQHRIRGMAASYLGVLNDRTVIPLLLKALEDDHAYVRSCAALGLGRLRASEAKEKLTTVMEEDWDQTVRSRSKEALERIKQS